MTERTGRPVSGSGTYVIGGDLPVHRLGFGAMRITGQGIWGEPDDHDEAIRVLRRAVERGVNLIDTADSYGPYVSEDLIAEALHPYPDDLLIATKGGHTRSGPDEWAPVGRPEYLRQCVEMSLRRLKLDRIDLYQLHRIDPKVPAAEQIGVLKAMQDEGKIRHIGLSEVTVDQAIAAREQAPIVSIQNLFNLTNRKAQDVLEYCEAENLAFIPWNPLAIGALARPGGPLAEAASRQNATPAQFALAWLLHRSPVMLPIPGTSRVSHLEDNLAAASISLSADEVAELESLAH